MREKWHKSITAKIGVENKRKSIKGWRAYPERYRALKAFARH